MAPLTALTKISAKSFKKHWTQVHTDCFKKIKAMIAEDVLLTYPDPNLPFEIQTDASDYQLGAVILQNNKPVAFFLRKLSDAQTHYPASNKEALCIQEVLHEYRDILYGAEIIIKTDHKNLTQCDIKSPCLLHWHLLIEEFAPTIVYLPRQDNVIADSISHLPHLPLNPPKEKQENDQIQNDLEEIFMFYPNNIDTFPLNFETIAEQQNNDPIILALLQQNIYEHQEFNGSQVICCQINGQPKIVLNDQLLKDAIHWYHFVLGHPGITRLITTLNIHFFYPKTRIFVHDYVRTCDECQRYKAEGARYAHLPPQEDLSMPWEEIAVDLIGPWECNIEGIGRVSYLALTIIDTCTNLTEITRIENRSARHVFHKLEQAWFSWYPRPLHCIHDQGTKFKAAAFQVGLHQLGIHPVATTMKNLQANAIVERMHKVVGDMIHMYTATRFPATVQTATEAVDAILASCQRALWATIHTTFGVTLGALVFHRDMLLPIPILADYNLIREKRQAIIDDNNRKQNLQRLTKDYQVGDQVLVHVFNPRKDEARGIGPYEIVQVHVNGTVSIQRAPQVIERINVCGIKPYRQR